MAKGERGVGFLCRDYCRVKCLYSVRKDLRVSAKSANKMYSK
jgi:hypothetical protein